MKDKIFKSILYFFIAMFCCTLISRTSASVTVAKVATEHLKSGSLTCRFQGNGKIMAADRTFQSLPEGQKIARILVKEGNAVKKGEAVVLLDLPYLLERITEKEREIQKVQLTLEQLELEGKENARVAATIPAESALRKAIRHLEEVQSAYEEEKATVEEVTATEKACEQAWEVYDLAELEEEAFAENEAARKEALELSKKEHSIGTGKVTGGIAEAAED